MVIAFIDDHRSRFGVEVEPICRVLTEHQVSITPSPYYAARVRPPSQRARRDAELLVQIERVHGVRDPTAGWPVPEGVASAAP